MEGRRGIFEDLDWNERATRFLAAEHDGADGDAIRRTLIKLALDRKEPHPGFLDLEVDRLRVEALRGSGGFGKVFCASDGKACERPVALKVVRLRDDADRGYFDQESRMLARIRPGKVWHPTLLPLLRVGEFEAPWANDERYGWFATPWLEGACGLRDHPGSMRERVGLFLLVVDGVAQLHRHGLAHRDIHPDNVLVASGQPYLVDFGLAVDPREQVAGRPGFTDREIVAKATGYRQDVHALAGTMYHLLTGRVIGPSRTPQEWNRELNRLKACLNDARDGELRDAVEFAAAVHAACKVPDWVWAELDPVVTRRRDDRGVEYGRAD